MLSLALEIEIRVVVGQAFLIVRVDQIVQHQHHVRHQPLDQDLTLAITLDLLALLQHQDRPLLQDQLLPQGQDQIQAIIQGQLRVQRRPQDLVLHQDLVQILGIIRDQLLVQLQHQDLDQEQVTIQDLRHVQHRHQDLAFRTIAQDVIIMELQIITVRMATIERDILTTIMLLIERLIAIPLATIDLKTGITMFGDHSQIMFMFTGSSIQQVDTIMVTGPLITIHTTSSMDIVIATVPMTIVTIS